MPYAVFDHEGQVLSLHRHDPGVGELVSLDDPAVRRFVGLDVDGPFPPTRQDGGEDDAFARLDADFIRVLEDVIEALTDRHVINITDLPDVVQGKLFERRSFRGRRSQRALDLIGNQGVDTII